MNETILLPESFQGKVAEMTPSLNPPPGPSPGFKTWSLALLAGVLLLTAAAYAPILSAPFAFDDFTNITDNPFLPHERLDLGSFLSSLPRQPNPFRPLAYLSFAFNFILFGPDPQSFHLLNLAIHLLSCVALYFLLSALLRAWGARLTPAAQDWLALAITALWALHPVQTESVSYVVQRMTSLAGLFYLLALLAYVQARTATSPRRRLAAGGGLLFFGIAACATKETSFTLPVFLLALEYFFFSPAGLSTSRRWLWGLAVLLILAALAAALLLGPSTLRWIAQGYAVRDFTLTERLLTETRVVFYYLFLSGWPIPQLLRLQYDFAVSHSLLHPFATLFAVLGLMTLAAAFLIGLRKSRLWAFAILWFFGQLAIESSVIPLELGYEHRLYLPVLAPIAAFVFLVLGPGRWWKARLILVGAVALLLGADTYARNRVWTDSTALWRDAVSKSPASARAWSNLGKVYREQGRLERGLHAYRQAVRLDPNYVHAYLNLSGVYSSLGDTRGAREAAERAAALEPANLRALLAMAEVESESGNLEAALTWYQRAWQANPDDPQTLESLAGGFLEAERPDLAREVIEKYQRLYPNRIGVSFLWGNYYYYLGRWSQAATAYRQELELDPDSTGALNNLGAVLLKLHQPDQAAVYIQRAIDLAPGNGMLHENLCEAEFDRGRLGPAEASCRRAVGLAPSFYLGWKKLGEIYLREGRREAAVPALAQARKLAPDDPEVKALWEEAGGEPGGIKP